MLLLVVLARARASWCSLSAPRKLGIFSGAWSAGAPWQPWDDGGRHDQWVCGLASFSTIIACQVSAGPQKSCLPSYFNSYCRNRYWNSRAFLFGQKWVTHEDPRLAITSPKIHLRSNPKLANNHKYHLEHFGRLNHAHSTKIDWVTALKPPFLTTTGRGYSRTGCLRK